MKFLIRLYVVEVSFQKTEICSRFPEQPLFFVPKIISFNEISLPMHIEEAMFAYSNDSTHV